jgi:hypothetical protein
MTSERSGMYTHASHESAFPGHAHGSHPATTPAAHSTLPPKTAIAVRPRKPLLFMSTS